MRRLILLDQMPLNHEKVTIHLSRLLHGEQSNFLPENLNPELLFSEGGLGETALLAQKSGFPQKYLNRNPFHLCRRGEKPFLD